MVMLSGKRESCGSKSGVNVETATCLADIVAPQIHQHDVLAALLVVRQQIFFQGLVLAQSLPSPSCACQRPGNTTASAPCTTPCTPPRLSCTTCQRRHCLLSISSCGSPPLKSAAALTCRYSHQRMLRRCFSWGQDMEGWHIIYSAPFSSART